MMGAILTAIATAAAVSCAWLAVLYLHSQRRVTELEAMLTSFIRHGQAEPPKASVLDPGPIDDETKVQIEIRGRMIDRATEYLAEEGAVSPERAREEAERLIAQFEAAGRAD